MTDQINRRTSSRGPTTCVPTWLLVEAQFALDAATTIGKRSCKPSDHLHYANHDRIVREIDKHLPENLRTPALEGVTELPRVQENAPCAVCGRCWNNHPKGPSSIGCPGYAPEARSAIEQPISGDDDE